MTSTIPTTAETEMDRAVVGLELALAAVASAHADVAEAAAAEASHKALMSRVYALTLEARRSVWAARNAGMDGLRDMGRGRLISEDDRKLGEIKVHDLAEKYVARVELLELGTRRQITGR